MGVNVVASIFEKHKGVNDWRIENIGEIQDLKFVEDSEWVYTVSKDGLLSLFDYRAQEFIWKNKLTLSRSATQEAEDLEEELFKFGYLSRNLLVHSQRRAMLVNTAGHANFEIDFATIFG
jgi:hypothetical protein